MATIRIVFRIYLAVIPDLPSVPSPKFKFPYIYPVLYPVVYLAAAEPP